MLKNATTFNRADRLQAFIDAQKIYLQHMPAIFFGTPRVRIATSMRTLNATPSPLRPHLLWNAENLAALTYRRTSNSSYGFERRGPMVAVGASGFGFPKSYKWARVTPE